MEDPRGGVSYNQMVLFAVLVCLLVGVSSLLPPIKAFKVSTKLSTLASSGQLSHTLKGKIGESLIIQESAYLAGAFNELGGPYSNDYLKYLSYMRIFQFHLDAMYNKSLKIRCPFFRRRATDSVDSIASVVQFILARHKSLPLPILPSNQPSLRTSGIKILGLSVSLIANILLKDWKATTDFNSLSAGKGYYITGKLTHEIYRDDCFFDGPDPDMPVSGLQKYVTSTSQLFDHRASRADLISLEICEAARTVTIHWRLEGILNLPWHPKLKPWTGQTTYYIDDSGLIERHVELWDISVIDAFVSTLFPFLNFGAPAALPIKRTSIE